MWLAAKIQLPKFNTREYSLVIVFISSSYIAFESNLIGILLRSRLKSILLTNFNFSEHEIEHDPTLLAEAKVTPTPDQLLEDLGAPTVLESTLDDLQEGLTGEILKYVDRTVFN